MALVLADGGFDGAYGLAAAVFAIAALTDFVDGYLARRWQQTSVLGAFLDTTADKLLVAGTLLALVAVDRAWVWAAFLIVGREIAVMTLRGIVALEGAAVPPSIWGKSKASVQFLALFLAIVRLEDRWGPMYADEWAMTAAVVVTVASGVDYTWRFARVVRAIGAQ